MNRRELLKTFRDFCVLNGLSGILVPEAFGQTAPAKKRFVSFVMKYTGGTTLDNGPGYWDFANTLAPLAAYKGDICTPMGLSCKFTVQMNSHAAPQICALTGAMTGNKLNSKGDTYYPTGNLLQYSTGEGKSIDVLIGEKLQSIYNSQLPVLQISNIADIPAAGQASTMRNSSYGKNGVLLPTYAVVNDLSAELKNRILCDSPVNNPTLLAALNRKLAALDAIKSNTSIFNSSYLIDKDKFDNIQSKVQKAKTSVTSALNSSGTTTKPAVCGKFPTLPELTQEFRNEDSINKKMNVMFDLAIAAFQANVTRSLNVNLYTMWAHEYSHYVEKGTKTQYLNTSKFLQQQVANFVAKLKAAGMYDETLIFCNAGSCMSNQLHNYDNLSTYVINGDKSGVVGSAKTIKPVGSLLLDILHKFDIKYDTYGGKNHVYGLAKKGNFI